jgi:hypothetical protein
MAGSHLSKDFFDLIKAVSRAATPAARAAAAAAAGGDDDGDDRPNAWPSGAG